MATALEPPVTALDSRAAAEAYVGGVCFKVGPPHLIGAELEWLTAEGDGDCSRPSLASIAAALGPYAPKSIAFDSPARPLPRGSYITIEPGGQIEISSQPSDSAEELLSSLREDATFLRKLLESRSIDVISAAADTDRRPERLLTLPRYATMESVFARIGPFGKLMMCNTAATQVSVDAGADAAEIAARWTALYSIGPALLAAFACSPVLHGAPAGRWASQRMRTWLELDRARTEPPVGSSTDSVRAYAAWAVDVPLLCVRREGSTDWSAPPGATFADWVGGALDDELGRRPDTADLDYHLTTVFPPIRAAGHLEVRYIDAQPGDSWDVPIYAIDALMSSSAVVAEASALAASTARRWADAAEHGLADREIRSAATNLLTLAAAYSPAPAKLDSAAKRCRRGIDPARQEYAA